MNQSEPSSQRVRDPVVVEGDAPLKPEKDVDQLKRDMEEAADRGDARLRNAEQAAESDTAAVRPDRSGNEAGQ